MIHHAMPHFATAAFAAATAALVTLTLTPAVRAIAVRCGWIAKPVEDRWGKRVIARLGGSAMFAGFLAASALWVPLRGSLVGLLVGAALVFGLGLADDLRRLPPSVKLIAQLLIGCLVVAMGIRIELIRWPWLSIPLSILWFVLVMNAFNLLDNMDGLAAGIGALAAGFCSWHAALAGQWAIVTLSAILGGCCVGFLRFNFPPAKIYMGDSGSHFLGLCLAALALLGSWHHSTQLLSVLAVPVLVLAVPIFDTCFVTVQRLLHGQHPFEGGTDHVSHRLAILGLSERQTALTLYVVSGLLGAMSVLSATMRPLPALISWLFVLSLLVLVGRYLSHVNVYRAERQPSRVSPAPQERPSTLIDTMLLHKRRLIEILVDFVLVSSAYVVAHLLRFEGTLTGELQRLIVQSLPIILVIQLSCFAGFGLYRGVWRYLGLTDLITVFKAVTLGSLLSSLALLYLWRFEGYSRAVFIIDWMLTLLTIGGSRVIERLLDEWIMTAAGRRLPVLIVGAGDTGERVLRYLRYEDRAERWVVGLLDDDVRTHGSVIHGVAVLGSRARLSEVLRVFRVREVLVAISDPPGDLLQHVQRCCEPQGVSWRVVTAGVMTPHG
jgi:UDP-GlcNAc:undecaprenyl-phosphate GlcNAc-1-phosphate transferase